MQCLRRRGAQGVVRRVGGFLLACVLMFGFAMVADARPAAPLMAATPPVTVEFAGSRIPEYRFGPVYRRFDTMQIVFRNVPAENRRELQISFDRWGPYGWRPAVELPTRSGSQLGNAGSGALRADVRLAPAKGSLPVGKYRAELRRPEGGRMRLLARAEFAVIFNALRPADRAVYLKEAADYLAPDLDVIHLQDDENALPFGWDLNIHDPAVFDLALRAVSGLTEGRSAIRRLAQAAADQGVGHWPALAATDGEVPPGTPPDEGDDWQSQPRSVLTRLAGGDRRAQCYDFAAISVAMLRSVGLPATAVTALGPLPMPHPYDGSRRVEWAFHVWPEVYADNGWWAFDPTYLRPPGAGIPSAPGPELQGRTGPWFTSLVGSETRVVKAVKGVIQDVSALYRSGQRP